ncbi:MAG: glycosyltransferase [Ardenticatenales bacterium]
MHVLVFPSWYPDAADSQRGRFFRDQARLLADHGHTVGVLTVPPPRFLRDLPAAVRGRSAANPIRRVDDHGLPTYGTARWLWLPGRFGPRVIRWQLARASDRLWRRYVADHGVPEVIHAQGTLLGGFLAVRHGRRHSVPVVVTEHSSAFLRGLIRPDERPVVAAVLDAAAAVCAVGPGLAAALRAFAPAVDVRVVPNPVDVAYFTPPVVPPAAVPFRFLAVAHLRPVKGVDVLIRAFAKAFGPKGPTGPAGAVTGTQTSTSTSAATADATPAVVLRIAGEGPERGRLVALADDLGVADRIVFLGALSREQLLALYHDSHALVSASEVETFGLAVAEALACGLRVVATRSGGPDALVEAAGGWSTPVGDVDAMAEAMGEAIGYVTDDAADEAADETTGEAGRRHHADPRDGRAAVVACCAPDAWVRRMEDLFASAIRPTSIAASPMEHER